MPSITVLSRGPLVMLGAMPAGGDEQGLRAAASAEHPRPEGQALVLAWGPQVPRWGPGPGEMHRGPTKAPLATGPVEASR